MTTQNKDWIIVHFKFSKLFWRTCFYDQPVCNISRTEPSWALSL